MKDIQTLLDWGFNPKFITPEFLASQNLTVTFPWRFIAKVEKTESCWIWTASIVHGYGSAARGPHQKSIGAHIASWLLHFGLIPKETPCVLHNCPGGDNRACINPKHLWLGTIGDNNRDTIAKGRWSYPPHEHGEKHPMAKITWPQRDEIIRLYAQCSKRTHRGEHSASAIGARFGITGSAVLYIVYGQHWKEEFRP